MTWRKILKGGCENGNDVETGQFGIRKEMDFKEIGKETANGDYAGVC